MSWNILEGGRGGGGRRLRAIVGVLRRLDPDVVALQECGGWHERGSYRLRQVAAELGLAPIPYWTASGHHLVVLTGLPAETVYHDEQGHFRHGFQHVVLRKAGASRHLFNTHLDPYAERSGRSWRATVASWWHWWET